MHPYSIYSNDVTQVKHIYEPKLTFGELGIKLLLLENVQNYLNMLQMLLPSAAVDKNVKKEEQYKLS